MELRKVFVEKKQDYNVEAKALLTDFKEYLKIGSIKSVRLLNLYHIFNAGVRTYEKIRDNLLWEEELDYLYEENFPLNRDEKVFRLEYVLGQYNQREDSANLAIQKLLVDNNIRIKHSKIVVVEGINDRELDRIKKYYINPVEVREVDIDHIPYIKEEREAKAVGIIEGFINMDEAEIQASKESMGIGLDMEDLLFTQKYFRDREKRNPTVTELKVIDTYWSDHCRHTTFMTRISNVEIEDSKYKKPIEAAFKEYLLSREFVYGENPRPMTLMDLATINMKEIKKKGLLEDLEESEEINAASIEIDVDVDGRDEKWLLMFKNETHNHPTEIEPFGGASTCLGGCIRDPLSGRSFIYQAMRISGAGDPRESFDDTLEGKLPQRKISQLAMEGYSSYGNHIGIPAGFVEEIYHEGYKAKRMEVGALVAAAPKDNVIRKSPRAGDLIVLVGGRTGKDGLGGAVGSSQMHTEESLEDAGAEVQKGNPSLERKILRLFRKKHVSNMIKKSNDFGAGGVAVAIGELAAGVEIYLDRVSLKYPGLDGTEIALSESQERMAVLIDKENLESFINYAREEDLEASWVASVSEDKRLRMLWQDSLIVDIAREFLDTNGVVKDSEVRLESLVKTNYFHRNPEYLGGKDLEEDWKKNLSHINHASQIGLMEKFDQTVGSGTVLMPMGGKYGFTKAEGMAAKIPVVKGETRTCSLMTYGFDPYLTEWSPFHGGMFAVVESLARITAMGGDFRKARLTFQEYFERLDKRKEKWGKAFAALLGAFIAEKALDIPSIGGKDSMSGSFEDIHVPPTIISFAVTVDRLENIISPEFKGENNQVLLIALDIDHSGMIDFKQMEKNYLKIKELVNEGKILSASTVKAGGIARSLSEMSFGNKIGFKLDRAWDDNLLFLPLYGSIIVEVNENPEKLLEGIEYKVLGTTTGEENISLYGCKLDLNELINIWTKPLEVVYPRAESIDFKKEIGEYRNNKIRKSKFNFARPKVLLPIFTGSFGEYDMEKAFSGAGAQVESLVFKSLDRNHIEDSYRELAKRIKACQILGLADGAVMGNEPDGGGKVLANILKNPYVEEAIMELLNKGDGLILGIGNGFQALIKSGLIPYGSMEKLDGDRINISYNHGGHHLSKLVKVKVISNLSPWFYYKELGELQSLPLSTKEGRIVGSKSLIEKLSNRGQIASQYLEENLVGSTYGIEALTSPDGKILGRMGNSDRVHNGLYKNLQVLGRETLFNSGVDYFK